MSVYCNDNNVNETDIQELAERFIRSSCSNMIPPEKAKVREHAGIRLFGKPTVSYISADDLALSDVKDADRKRTTTPKELLPSAETVVTVFLPFTDELRKSANESGTEASEWIYGRIEGQRCVKALMNKIRVQLISEGHDVIIPSSDPERSFTDGYRSEEHEPESKECPCTSISNITCGTMLREDGHIGRLITSKRIEPTVCEHHYDHHVKKASTTENKRYDSIRGPRTRGSPSECR